MERELTTLEYIVLGLVSIEPQSGYSIISYFETDAHSWSASPGSVYPILKRLEKQEFIAGDLEMEYETRPRKVYTLTQLGEETLDGWLRQVPQVLPMYEQREIGIWRFRFMEGRLSAKEILQWLDDCMDVIQVYDYGRKLFIEGIEKALAEQENQPSIHTQLILEQTIMEINMHLTWLQMAKARIEMQARQE